MVRGKNKRKKEEVRRKKKKKSREAHSNEIYHLYILPLRTHVKNGVQ